MRAPGTKIFVLTLSETLPAIITNGIAQQFAIRFYAYHTDLASSFVNMKPYSQSAGLSLTQTYDAIQL